MKTRIMSELKKVFRPEFLNRIDEVIVFHKLTKDEVKEIVDLLMKRIRESLAERELSLNLSDDAADVLVDKGWDPAMGARPLRRAIQRYIEDPLADEVLAQTLHPGSTIEVERLSEDERAKEAEATDGDAKEFRISIIKPKERKREAVGVGGKGGSEDQPEIEGSKDDGSDLPDEHDVLPDVPDAPPAPEGEGEGEPDNS
jgi:ATP-dependent Clp protease ATP-binding subunit ClpC